MASELKLAWIEDVIRIRRVQQSLPLNRDLATVRANLEEYIGATVSQRIAARTLGVSHSAVQRWISSGDVPVVTDPRGRKGIPTRFLIDLALKIDRDRGDSGRSHSLEPVMTANRRRAERLRRRGVCRATARHSDPHERAADFALAYHHAVAEQLTRDQVCEALQTVWRLREKQLMHQKYADEWEQILSGDIRSIKSTITSESELGKDLRQNSPFAGTLSEPERVEVVALMRA